MGAVVRSIFAVVVVSLLTSSCAMMPSAFKPKPDVRLVRVQVPESMRENLPYEVAVTFDAQGEARIQKVCIQWVTLTAPIQSPGLYCYSHEVEANQPVGAVCSGIQGEGVYRRMSPIACTDVRNVQYGETGKFTVALNPGDVKTYYNAIECRVQYLQEGELKESNKVTARVLVEK